MVGRDGAEGRKLVRRGSLQRIPGDQHAAAAPLPEVREMALARARRAMQDEPRGLRWCRPIGPALDPVESGGIAFRNEEVGAAERRAMRQIDRQLPHRSRVRLLTLSAPVPGPVAVSLSGWRKS